MQQSVDPGLAFRTAANDGDVSQLELLYREDPSLLNQPGTKSGKTALHFAISSGRVAAVKWLMQQGANIHAKHEKNPITPYDLGLKSTNPEIVQLFLAAGVSTLSVTDKTMDEGAVALLDFKPIGAEFKSHLKASFGYAMQKWRALKLENSEMPMPIAIQILDLKITHYFATEQRKDYVYPGPNGSRYNLAMQLVTMILTLQKSDKQFYDKLDKDVALARSFSDLCFLHALVLYEDVAATCLKNPNPSKEQQAKIIDELLICDSSLRRADHFYTISKDAVVNQQYALMKKQLIRQMYTIRCAYEPQHMGFKELTAHIARKNANSAKRQAGYHGQLIYNLDTERQCEVNSVVIQSLIEAMKKIKAGEQPRTQFIVDAVGYGHALLLDVNYSATTEKFELVCVDPAEVATQHEFLDVLTQALQKQQLQFEDIIAIQAGLIKDMSSCHTFALAISGPLSRLSYDQLKANVNLPQPEFMNGHTAMPCAPLSKVTWRHVGALGQKVMMMDQATQKISHILKPYFSVDENYLKTMIEGFLLSYSLPDTVPVYLTGKTRATYIHARRHHLRQRLKTNPYQDLSFSEHQALMLLCHKAMGAGPQREFEALLQRYPNKIHERSPRDGSTPLHWAYKTDNKKRIALLKENGASEDITDSKGLLPRQWRNKQG